MSVEVQDRGVVERIAAARAAQPVWAATTLAARADTLRTVAALVASDAEGLAATLAEGSRPAAEIWSGEIVPTLDALRWLARQGQRTLRPTRLRGGGLQWYFRRCGHELRWEPYGVVGIVTPANAPLFLAVPQIAAALLAGNAVLWKPSPSGSDLARRVVGLIHRAGLPPAVLQVVVGGAREAQALVAAGVDKLHFTGSSEAGLALYGRQAARGRPAALELSGRHVAIVLADADLEATARGLLWGKLANGGRNCISVQQVLVEQAAAEGLLEALKRVTAAHGRGDAWPATGVDGASRLVDMVDEARSRGAQLVSTEGGVALLAGTTQGMRVVDEEIQGPILPLAAVASADEAVAWVNRSAYRLSASVWTRSTARARALAGRLDVGQVWINDVLHPAAHPEVTLAGRGASGFGASRGRAGLLEMAQPKVVSEMPLTGARRHWAPPTAATVDLFRATVRLGFARGLRARLGALGVLARVLVRLAGHAS